MSDFDLSKMLNVEHKDLFPPAIAEIMQAFLDGRLRQMVIVAELDDGNVMDAIPVFEEGEFNAYTMVGALEVVKRDYMRCYLESRVNYAEIDDDGE